MIRSAGDAAFHWDGLADKITLWNSQIDQLPKEVEGSRDFLSALQKISIRVQKCTVPGLSGYGHAAPA